MANSSIYAVFERMWQNVLAKINEHTLSANKITSGILDVERGGTGYDSIVDTEYTTTRYRASALVSTEATPDYNGTINWTYE
jgi:hypothetical protein